jgi:hypothetical protein
MLEEFFYWFVFLDFDSVRKDRISPSLMGLLATGSASSLNSIMFAHSAEYRCGFSI